MGKTYVKTGTHWHESSEKTKHPLVSKMGHRLACTGLVAIVGETSSVKPSNLCKACESPNPARTKAIRNRIEGRISIAKGK